MKTFLVGGAVRDILLGLEPKDKDFVVVGSSVEEMLSLGFTQVGKDFPVFLHPETGDEHALARKEKSTGASHTDFECDVKDVTLEEDLLRRDLTINSMAMDMHTSEVIDPFGGQKDLENKILRATSDAFEEDPLRVLRVMRFMSRLGEDWVIEGQTARVMHKLSRQVRKLPAERVWKEVERALMEQSPWLFLKVFANIFGIDIGVGQKHTMEATLRKAVKSDLPVEARWVIFLIRLHRSEADTLNDEVKAPTSFKRLFTKCTLDFNFNGKMTAEECLDVLLKLNGLHDDSHLPKVMSVLSCLVHHRDMHHVFWLWCNITQAAKSVKAQQFIDQGFTGKDIGVKMREERIKRIGDVLK